MCKTTIGKLPVGIQVLVKVKTSQYNLRGTFKFEKLKV